MEKHTITKATVLYIPRMLQHCPLYIKRLDEPMMFSALLLSPVFNEIRNGKYLAYDGPPNIE